MILSNIELYNVKGGAFSLTSTAINALSRAVTTLLKLGQTLGSNIRRIATRSYC